MIARNRAILLAAGTAILLSVPGFRFPYLFDDFNFLSGAQKLHTGSLLPDPGSLFYRPISRDIYFGALAALSPDSALLGHAVNAVLLALIVILGGTLPSRLLGNRAGIIAALLIAVFGQWPLLVGWVCGAQDLFAIAFLLAALHLELSGKNWLALVAFCCSLLSKETAAAGAPALLAANWLRSRSLLSTYGAALRIVVVVVVWAVIHPGVRTLVLSGGTHQPGTYIGLDHPRAWVALLRYFAVLVNLPPGFKISWPLELTWAIAVAAVPFLGGLWLLRMSESESGASRGAALFVRKSEVVWLGLSLALPPVLLTSLLVINWAPYYACFSVVGVSIAIAALLAAQPYPGIAAVITISFLLGAWSRGVSLDVGIPTERDLAPAARALVLLEKNFKRVAPTLPAGSIVYVSTMARGKESVYIHLHYFQVLRVWYGDPTIQTLRPELRVSSSSAEALFGVDPRLNVFQIDEGSLAVRSSDGSVEHREYRSALWSYAAGLVGQGERQRGVDILLQLSPLGTWEHVTDTRIAAMLLLSQGEIKAAVDLLRDLPNLPTRDALEIVCSLLTMPERGTAMEEPALLAFGFSPRDPKVIRPLLRGLLSLGYFTVSERLATRLLAVAPGDVEASTALEKIRLAKIPAGTRIMPRIPTLAFPPQ